MKFKLKYNTVTYDIFPSGSVIEEDGGYITGETSQEVDGEGDATPVTAVANKGYRFVRWADGWMSAQRHDTYVTGNKIITAIFEPLPTYKLTYNVKGQGQITGNDNIYYVSEGEDGSVMTAVPDDGYRFVCWSDGLATPQRQDTNITNNLTVTAIFDFDIKCFAHENLNKGDNCEICGSLCKSKIDGNILMSDSSGEITWAEYYNTTVTDVFAYCNNSIDAVYISNKVVEIADDAFKSYAISSVIFQENSQLNSIGKNSFGYCINLISIDLPDSLTSIGENAFVNCSNMIRVTIPDSVMSIGEETFLFCEKLTIYCEVASKPSGWHSFWKDYSTTVVWGYKG